jgi:hypothetical protein
MNILPIDFFFFYLAQTFDVISQKVFDLDLKVKIVKEKKQPVFPQKKPGFFLLRIDIETINGLSR